MAPARRTTSGPSGPPARRSQSSGRPRRPRRSSDADLAPARGVLIAVEGLPGAGVTTHARLLVNALTAAGVNAILVPDTREDSASAPIHNFAATVDFDARTVELLAAAARTERIATHVQPALQRGAVVVCDRYVASPRTAYRSPGAPASTLTLTTLTRFGDQGIRPDLNVVIDVDATTARQRAGQVAVSLDQADRARAEMASQAAADPDTWIVVDGARSPHEVARTVLGRVLEIIPPMRATG